MTKKFKPAKKIKLKHELKRTKKKDGSDIFTDAELETLVVDDVEQTKKNLLAWRRELSKQ